MYYVNYLDKRHNSIKDSETIHFFNQNKLEINYKLNLLSVSGSIEFYLNGLLPISAFSFDLETNFFTIRNIAPFSYEVSPGVFNNKKYIMHFVATIDIAKNRYLTSELKNEKLYYKYFPIFNVDVINDYKIKFENQVVADKFLEEVRSNDTKLNHIIYNNTYDLTPNSLPIKKFDSVSDYCTFKIINEEYDPKRPIATIFNFSYSPNTMVTCKKIKLTISVDHIINEQIIEINNPKIIKLEDHFYVLFDRYYFLSKKDKKIIAKVGEQNGLFIDGDSQIKIEAKFIVATEHNFKFVNYTNQLTFEKSKIDNFKNNMNIISSNKSMMKGEEIYELQSETRFS